MNMHMRSMALAMLLSAAIGAHGQGRVAFTEGNAGIAQELTEAARAQAELDAPPREYPMVAGALSYTPRAGAVSRKGDVSVLREGFAAGIPLFGFLDGQFSLAVDQEFSQYRFSSDAPINKDALDNGSITRFGVNYRLRIDDDWAAFAAGGLAFSQTGISSWDYARSGGGFIGARRQITPDFAFSLGVLGRSRLEDSPIFLPIPGIDWRITDRVTLRTAQGATLQVQLDETRQWFADLTANYEWREFRLDDDKGNPHADNVVTDQRVPIVAGIAYNPLPLLVARVYAGVVAWQEYQLRGGDEKLDSFRTDAMITMGASLALKF